MINPDADLSSLTPDSTLLFFLRTLFGTAAEFAVYIPDSGDAIVINKGQLVSMVERNCADAMIKRLPQLAERNIFRPLNVEKIDSPEDSTALYVKNTGSFIASLELALNPDTPQFPVWWSAPVPFAMSSRGVLKLNDRAVSMFGKGLEKLNASELPDRDEFIVRLDGLNGTRFIAFRNLSPGIFTIDDCISRTLRILHGGRRSVRRGSRRSKHAAESGSVLPILPKAKAQKILDHANGTEKFKAI